jgi:hypothetical protein
MVCSPARDYGSILLNREFREPTQDSVYSRLRFDKSCRYATPHRTHLRKCTQMRQRTTSRWPLLLVTTVVFALSGCASHPTKQRDPNQVMLTKAASAPAPTVLAAAAAIADQRGPTSVAPGANSKTPPPNWSLSENDRTLKAALERWSQIAGWRLLWELGVDYRIGAGARLDGKFEDAVSTVMQNLNQAEVPPKAIFYRGNHVVRIVAKGME